MSTIDMTAQSFARLLQIILRLRSEDGCSWDRDQTPKSMRGTLIEETFEAVDAISDDDADHAREELGDVLLNTVMIAVMYEQSSAFTLEAVIDELSAKLIRRHPHVFSKTEAAELSPAEVLRQWEVIKHGVEKRHGESALDEVPAGFPPLLKAYKMQKKASKRGFDWASADGAYDKVCEELAEACEAKTRTDEVTRDIAPFTVAASPAQNEAHLHLEAEIGDLLFSVVNWARKLRIDPTAALSRANTKFDRRFRAVEQRCTAAGKKMEECTLAELDSYWDDVKRCDE